MGKKNDVDDNSEIQLYRIKPQDHFIEAQVQEGDTLQAIALRFYCSVSIIHCPILFMVLVNKTNPIGLYSKHKILKSIPLTLSFPIFILTLIQLSEGSSLVKLYINNDHTIHNHTIYTTDK